MIVNFRGYDISVKRDENGWFSDMYNQPMLNEIINDDLFNELQDACKKQDLEEKEEYRNWDERYPDYMRQSK